MAYALLLLMTVFSLWMTTREKPVRDERVEQFDIRWIDNRRVLEIYTARQMYRCWDYNNGGDETEEWLSNLIGSTMTSIATELKFYQVDEIPYSRGTLTCQDQ